MIAFNDLSISQKLTRMNVIVIALLLLTTCAAFVGYEIHAFTRAASDHLSTDADVVGIDVTPAVLFNDAAAARETLLALRATPNVTQAAVYTPDGRMFARYVRNGQRGDALPRALPFTDHARHAGRAGLVVTRRIVSDGKAIGMVYVHSDLREIEKSIRDHAIIALGVLAVAFVLALIVSWKLEQRIAGPLLRLAETARVIASERDYSVRAEVRSKDETGLLAEAFNEMLRRIEEQSAGLEARVAERTEKLTAANKELATANESKDRFLATMSHELRTPLNAII